MRNVRKDINNQLREMEKSLQLSEDEGSYAHEQIQKITDKSMEDLNSLLTTKEKELLEQ